MSKSKLPDILLFSTADWDNPYWTNKQHVAVQLACRGHRVLYVESVGLRRPSASARDFKRALRRLRRGFAAPMQVRENIWVLSPLTIPLQASRVVRRVNQLILATSIKLWSLFLGLSARVLWTYSPITTELMDTTRWPLVVYHAVDDIKAQPGMPGDLIDECEKVLARRADFVFTTAMHLQREFERLNPETHYFPNVADFDHFNSALASATEIPRDMACLPTPRVGFVGAISGYKLDFALLRAVADARPRWSFVLIGDVGEGDPWTDISLLRGAPNIHLMGGRSYSEIPAYLKAMDAAILPCNINDYTRSMFPMKYFEYLAAGRPVVTTPLPAIVEFSHASLIAKDAVSFVAALELAMADLGPSLETRVGTARGQTYEVRTERMMALLEKRMSGDG